MRVRYFSYSSAKLGEEASPTLFWNRKKCPNFGKKSSDCVDLRVNFFIRNVFLNTPYEKKNSKMFLTKCLWECLNPTKPLLPWEISGWTPVILAQSHYFLRHAFLLNVILDFEYEFTEKSFSLGYLRMVD